MATDISAVTNFNTFEAASKILLIIIQHINTAPSVQYITYHSKKHQCAQLALMAGLTPGKCALDNVNSNFMLQQ